MHTEALCLTNNDKGKKLGQVDRKIHALSVEQLNDLVLGAKIGILETGWLLGQLCIINVGRTKQQRGIDKHLYFTVFNVPASQNSPHHSSRPGIARESLNFPNMYIRLCLIKSALLKVVQRSLTIPALSTLSRLQIMRTSWVVGLTIMPLKRSPLVAI